MCEQKIKETAENSKTNDAHEEKKPQPSEKEVPIQRNYTDLQVFKKQSIFLNKYLLGRKCQKNESKKGFL